MKKQIIFATFFILLLSIPAFAEKIYTSATFKTKIYCDHCSKCGSCKARVEKKVQTLKGVKSVSMDVANERIKVSFDAGTTSVKLIKDQINKAGYDADDQKAAPQYVEQLDGCCKQ